MTSDDISSSFRRLAGACDVHWHVEEKSETQVARGGSARAVESRISSVGGSVVDMADRTTHVANG